MVRHPGDPPAAAERRHPVLVQAGQTHPPSRVRGTGRAGQELGVVGEEPGLPHREHHQVDGVAVREDGRRGVLGVGTLAGGVGPRQRTLVGPGRSRRDTPGGDEGQAVGGGVGPRGPEPGPGVLARASAPAPARGPGRGPRPRPSGPPTRARRTSRPPGGPAGRRRAARRGTPTRWAPGARPRTAAPRPPSRRRRRHPARAAGRRAPGDRGAHGAPAASSAGRRPRWGGRRTPRPRRGRAGRRR